jgi:ABC-type transport system substrate-binding protein
MERFADIWAQDLRGVAELRVRRLGYAELLDAVRAGNFDIALLSFTTSADVDLYSSFHSSAAGSTNLSRIADSELDELLEKARTQRTRKLSRQIHRKLVELAPVAFLVSDVRLALVRDSVAGIGDTAEEWGARSLWRASR